ncbi:PREDICTED: nuclear pore complex protein NUP50A-like [Nicotiana attenuata]|uniref:Nuclear pore complex protein nup50a n=1 Tax=Nicotiana attenuata TaxID=49451 RepID=A0A1J6IXJ6_NICAT|nr:PREDICTED: nuclear pore complex protein NUP50A-like [Nicotiana attenuata]OIT05288.1 nuclear pore complex protein nup50a [Nicotiana attenuata]
MGDTENSLQPSKKRAALKEISRDNPGIDDDEDTADQETGTFKRASEEVMASRRIVKVRRNQTTSTTTAPSSNPFAAIRLPTESGVTSAVTTSNVESGKPEETGDVGEATGKEEGDVNKEGKKEPDQTSRTSEGNVDEPNVNKEKVEIPNEPEKPESAEKKVAEDEKIQDETKAGTVVEKSESESKKDVEVEKTENEEQIDAGGEKSEKGTETASFSSFQQLSSSQNAFTGLAGTGFTSTTFSFGVISKEGSPLGFGSESGAGSGSLFGAKGDQPSFGVTLPTNGNNSLFGNSGSSIVNKGEGTGFPSKEEVSVETGEENEKPVFTADSVLFEFLDGGWKERGKGELKVNVSTAGEGKARLVMRTKGNYRLILNASLYPEMKLTNMDKRGLTFACLNSAGDGKEGLSTIALKFKDASIVEEFRAAVAKHKGTTTGSLKTPENSPKASDD